MASQRATPRRANYNGVKILPSEKSTTSLAENDAEFERGCLIAGLAMAVSFGACFLNWWWFAC